MERPFNRAALEELLTRRFFFRPSFEIYNGVAGLYDLGPPGCAVQANILNIWRHHFILEEQMLEVDCTIMTKDEVFKSVPAARACAPMRAFVHALSLARSVAGRRATSNASPTSWSRTP